MSKVRGIDFIRKTPNQEKNANQIEVEISLLKEFRNHPFHTYTGERLYDLVESIKNNGVLMPIIIRPDGEFFEILSGHNRVKASKIAGLEKIPAIIKEDISDEEALIYVIETNLMQRSFTDMLPSEKALVLSIHHEKLFAQGKRNDIKKELELLENPQEIREDSTSGRIDQKLTSRDIVGEEYSLSASVVSRLLRINYLIKELKEMVDSKKLALYAGVELSFISEEWQSKLINAMNECEVDTLNLAKAKVIKKAFQENKISEAFLIKALLKDKSDNKNKVSVTISFDKYPKLKDKSKKEQREIVNRALEIYFSQNN